MGIIKRKIRRNNRKVDWENESKEQLCLIPGSPEYEEYKRDLKMHDPFRPNDEWHDELEQANAEMHAPKPVKEQDVNKDVGRRKYIRQQSKESKFKEAKRETIIAAKSTESEKDDKKAAKMKLKDLEEMAFDDGVDSEEYVSKTIRKYIE